MSRTRENRQGGSARGFRFHRSRGTGVLPDRSKRGNDAVISARRLAYSTDTTAYPGWPRGLRLENSCMRMRLAQTRVMEGEKWPGVHEPIYGTLGQINRKSVMCRAGIYSPGNRFGVLRCKSSVGVVPFTSRLTCRVLLPYQ